MDTLSAGEDYGPFLRTTCVCGVFACLLACNSESTVVTAGGSKTWEGLDRRSSGTETRWGCLVLEEQEGREVSRGAAAVSSGRVRGTGTLETGSGA